MVVISQFSNVSAKDIGVFHTSQISSNFNYPINIPYTNNSYANRVCFENFEYSENTNMSQRNMYLDDEFSAVIKSFKDVDFDFTNYQYYSKKLEVTSLKVNSYFSLNKYLTSVLSFQDIRTRIIIEDNSLQYYYLYFYFQSGNNFRINIYFPDGGISADYNYNTNLYYNGSFLPSQKLYDYVYIEFDKQIGPIQHFIKLDYVCYNQSGLIIKRNFLQLNLDSIKNEIVNHFQENFYTSTLSSKFSIIGMDYNFILNKEMLYQNAIINHEYKAYDLKHFYLLNVAYYNPNLKQSGTSKWYYATTLYQNRFLRYKTNATTNIPLQSDVLLNNFDEICKNSFSFKMELNINDTFSGGGYFTLIFNKSNFIFSVLRISSNLYLNVNNTAIAIANDLDDRLFIHAQFKNSIFSFSLYTNNIIRTFSFSINNQFESMDLERIQVLNMEIKPLNLDNMIIYTNQTLISSFYFIYKIDIISMFSKYTSIIILPEFSVNSIEDTSGKTYSLKSCMIYNMKFDFVRSSSNGEFTITSDYDYIRGFFIENTNLIDSFEYNFFTDNGGKLFIDVIFYTSTVSQLNLNCSIEIGYLAVYSDSIPANNLLINKALDIFIPLLIFGLIIVGFKSNSNSKYMAIIGMYIAIFVFYLIGYMSLLFAVLSFIFLTLGLYIILKHEKSEGGI